jgi:hypothetical protein
MPLTQRTIISGAHAFFFRDGDAYTVPGAGTASRIAKPGPTDPVWISLGVLEEATVSIDGQDIKIFAPTPGRQRLWDVITTKDELMIKFSAAELSAFMIETLFRTLALTGASTQFNPLEGKTKKGWLKFQAYDQADAQLLVLDVFAVLKITGDVNFGGGELAKCQFEALTLHSTLNTGTL